jgi:hypothetical protein
MSDSEIKSFQKKTGMVVRSKCDHEPCSKPITSTLIYVGDHGEYCSRECIQAAEPRFKNSGSSSSRKDDKAMSDEKKKVKKSKDKEEKPVKKAKKEVAEKKAHKTSADGPFREGSAIQAAFDLARAGTTRAKINKFCEDNEIGSSRVFMCLKRGEYSDRKWKYYEGDDGDIKCTLFKKKKD